jgi:hypothetical protein
MSVKNQVLAIIDEMIQDVVDNSQTADSKNLMFFAQEMGAFQKVRNRIVSDVEDDSR